MRFTFDSVGVLGVYEKTQSGSGFHFRSQWAKTPGFALPIVFIICDKMSNLEFS